MKKTFPYAFTLFTFLIFTISCAKKNEINLDEKINNTINLFDKYKTINDIEDLKLDNEFNLSLEDYTAFLNSVVFTDGDLRGFYYLDITKNLDDEELQRFWSHFGVNIEEHSGGSSGVGQRTELEVEGGECTILNSRPITRGCAPASPGWACIIPC